MLALACAGCAYNPPAYSPSAKNVQTLQNSGLKPFSISAIRAGDSNSKGIMCRAAGPIAPPNDQTYAQYIEDAFEQEMEIAGLSSSSGPSVRGTLEKVNFSSTGSSAWTFTLNFSNTAGKSTRIQSSFPFKSAFSADKACQRVAQNLGPAVEKLINDTVQDPAFRALLQ